MSNDARQAPTDLMGQAEPRLGIGDLVRTGENSRPHYRVIAVTEGMAWIRETQLGSDHIVPIHRCRKI